MRTLRSGKSLPDSPAVRRGSSTTNAVVPKPESTPATTRRASISAASSKITEASQQKKESLPPMKSEPKKTVNNKPIPEMAKPNSSIPKAVEKVEPSSSKKEVAEVTSDEMKEPSNSEELEINGENADSEEVTVPADEETVKKISPGRGRPRKSVRKIEPKIEKEKVEKIEKVKVEKAEVPPAPPTDRLAKTEICKVCNMGFTRKATLLRHSQIHEVETPEPEPVRRRRSSGKNTKSPAPAKGVITCDVCQLTFTRKAHLDRHTLLHSGEKPFPCDLCDQKFNRKDHMLSHRVKHNGETLISCTVCGMHFPSMKCLDIHAKEEHPDPDSQPDAHICETCGKSFLQRRYLQAHRKLHMRKINELQTFEHSEVEYKSSTRSASKPISEMLEIQYQSPQQSSRVHSNRASSSTQSSGSRSNSSQKPMVFLNRVVKLSADLALKSLKGCDTDVEVCLQDVDGEEGGNMDDVEEMDYDYETMVKQYPVEDADNAEGDDHSEDAYAMSSTHPQQLECSVCGKAFTDRSTLRKHYRVHKKRFICRFCGLRLASAGSLMRHNLIHTGKKEFGCDLCGRKFSRKDTLAVHLAAHDKSTTRTSMSRPYLCTVCGATYTMKFNLIRHVKMCHSSKSRFSNAQGLDGDDFHTFISTPSTSTADKDMVISLMPDLESLPQRFDNEVDVSRVPYRKIKLEPIDYDEVENAQFNSFENAEDLFKDEEEEEEEENEEQEGSSQDGKSYDCDHCEKSFKTSKSLNTHKWYVGREKQFVCHICKRGFKYSSDLNRHVATHTVNKDKSVPNNLPPRIPKLIPSSAQVNLQQRSINNALETRPFGCKMCPQRFNHRSNLSRHVRLLHNTTAARKRVPNSINLQNYLKKLQVRRSGPAQIEKIIQRQQQQQQQHVMKAVEPANESWTSWDGNDSMNLPDLSMEGNSSFGDQEINSLNVKDFPFTVDMSSSRPFSCGVCQKAFENKSNLWTHMRIHNKTFICSFCGLKVATHGDLVLHIRTHTGERPFKCELCEWKFSRKSALNKHTLKYHSPGKGKILRPWKYREERIDGNNGNLKFKFIRSSPQKDDFQIEKMGNANPNVQIFKTSAAQGNVPQQQQKPPPPGLKPLPRLAPAPFPKPDTTILKSVLQHAGGMMSNNSTEPGPSFLKPPLLQKSPAVANNKGVKPTGRTNDLFMCRKCALVITGKSNYIDHMKTHQTAGPEVESQKIELRFSPNFTELAAKPFNCVECGERFSQKAQLSKHQLSHQQSEAVRCTICGKICSSLGFLSRHYQYVHPDTFNPAEQARFRVPQLDVQNNEQLNWVVPEVVMDMNDDQSQPRRRDKPEHTATDEEGNESLSPCKVGPDGIEIPSPCERCGKKFSNKKSRSDHVWYCFREKCFRCPIKGCNKEFKLKHDVARHLSRHNSDKRLSTSLVRGDEDNINQNRNSMDEEYEDYLIENDMNGTEEFEEGQDEMDPSSFLEQSMGETSEVPEQHDCELCGKSFNTRQKYMYHKYYHEREAKYGCKSCEERFKLRSHLERHIRTYHNKEKPVHKVLHCSQCPRKFTREYDLNTHIHKTHKKLTPSPHPLSILKTTLVMGGEDHDEDENHVPSTSVSVTKINQQDPSTHPLQESPKPPFQNYDESYEEYYEEEGQSSQNEEMMDQSNNEQWQNSDDGQTVGVKDGVFRLNNGMYTCGICSKVFKEKKAVDAHRYYHNREQKHACRFCGARFKQNSDLQRHNRIHHGPNSNTKMSIHCPHCNRSFTDDRYLRMHIRRYHPEVSQGSMSSEGNANGSSSSNPRSSGKDKSIPFIKEEPMDYNEVNDEGDGFNTGVWNADDQLVDLTIIEENQDEEENSHVIENWSRRGDYQGDDDQSGTEQDMNAIEEVEYRNYNNEASSSKAKVQQPSSCSVTCGSCSIQLPDTNAIARHICSPKGKVAVSNSSSNLRRRSDTSVFDCKICGATFTRSNELILHNRIHISGAKPFVCRTCGKNFVQRVDLNTHLQAEHNQSMQVFSCQFCPKNFFVRKSLDSHRRRHHANIIQFHKCRNCQRQFTSQRFLEAHIRSCGVTPASTS